MYLLRYISTKQNVDLLVSSDRHPYLYYVVANPPFLAIAQPS